MKTDLTRYAPVGIRLKTEIKFFVWGLVCAVLYSFGFLLRYTDYYTNLFWDYGTKKILVSGVVMPDYIEILNGAFGGFVLLQGGMLLILAYHYIYHWQGSKSIYLMRRLPNHRELHKRCLMLPIIAIMICLLFVIILFLLYFGIYMFVTPEECIQPGQWQRIWSVIL